MALVITRKAGEGCKIILPDGRKIEFDIIKVKGYEVRVRFNADKDIPVNRAEIARRINPAHSGLPATEHNPNKYQGPN